MLHSYRKINCPAHRCILCVSQSASPQTLAHSHNSSSLIIHIQLALARFTNSDSIFLKAFLLRIMKLQLTCNVSLATNSLHHCASVKIAGITVHSLSLDPTTKYFIILRAFPRYQNQANQDRHNGLQLGRHHSLQKGRIPCAI